MEGEVRLISGMNSIRVGSSKRKLFHPRKIIKIEREEIIQNIKCEASEDKPIETEEINQNIKREASEVEPIETEKEEIIQNVKHEASEVEPLKILVIPAADGPKTPESPKRSKHPKQLVCGVCQSTFKKAYNFNRHFKLHTGLLDSVDQPLKCHSHRRRRSSFLLQSFPLRQEVYSEG